MTESVNGLDCSECGGCIKSFGDARQSMEALEAIGTFPTLLSSHESALRSTLFGNLAQAKRELGWKLNRMLKGDCPLVKAGGECALSELVSLHLNNGEKVITGLVESERSRQRADTGIQ